MSALLSRLFRLPKNEMQGLAGYTIALERHLCGLKRKEVLVDHQPIPYLMGGKGAPLVLVHGFGGSKDNFNRFCRELVKHFTVYAVDLPGFGATERDSSLDYGIEAQAKRLNNIIHALGLKKAHLAGNSMGGWISGVHASLFPEDTASVLFLAPAGLKESRKSEVLRHFDQTGEILLTASTGKEYERIVDLVMFKRPAFAPRFVIKAMAARAKRDQPLHQQIYRNFKSGPSNLSETLMQSGYEGPALIVWGKNDRVLHVDGARELKQALPQASVMILEETGHVPMMEKPAQVAKAYIHWRNQIDKE